MERYSCVLLFCVVGVSSGLGRALRSTTSLDVSSTVVSLFQERLQIMEDRLVIDLKLIKTQLNHEIRKSVHQVNQKLRSGPKKSSNIPEGTNSLRQLKSEVQDLKMDIKRLAVDFDWIRKAAFFVHNATTQYTDDLVALRDTVLVSNSSAVRLNEGIAGLTDQVTDRCPAVPTRSSSRPPDTSATGVRLVGPSPVEGRLEVFVNGQWGTVCNDDFTDMDARVVCRSLGFGNGITRFSAFYQQGSGPIWMDDVHCQGDEESIFDCQYEPVSNCDHSEDVGIKCQLSDVDEGTVRLVNEDGASHYGRVEIFHRGEWGTVCNDGWDATDAQVVCRQLGLGGGETFPDPRYGAGSGRIWLDQVACDGSELSLQHCTAWTWGNHDCTHSEDASIRCSQADVTTPRSEDIEGAVRLVGSAVRSPAGNVQLYHDGMWGSICDDKWSSLEAAVVCRQLGLGGGIALRKNDSTGSGPIWLIDVTCRGDESNLTSCSFDEWGTGSCDHRQYAGVSCYGVDGSFTSTSTPALEETDEVLVYLAGGPTPEEGVVQVRYKQYVGTICDDGFNDKAAEVVCRMLGYRYGRGRTRGHHGPGWGSIVLDDLQCTGFETSIAQCQSSGWGNHNCDHTEDAGVYCFNFSLPSPTTTPASGGGVRLVGGVIPFEGRVEVLYNGTWGTVCDDDWDDTDAAVVCRMLGMIGGLAIRESRFSPGTGPIHVDDVMCRGFETSLSDCPSSPWGSSNCNHGEDAGVICDGYLPNDPGAAITKGSATKPSSSEHTPDSKKQHLKKNPEKPPPIKKGSKSTHRKTGKSNKDNQHRKSRS